MMRRCSKCNESGHNSRTCSARSVKLMGVRIDRPIRNSASTGSSLVHYSGGGASSSNGGGGSSPDTTDGGGLSATASEGFVEGSLSSHRTERKEAVAWSEEEHKMFLLGLKNLGKGNWLGISRHYVVSRTPSQVASHAQKYFLRQSSSNGRNRRCSLFDTVPDEIGDAQDFPVHSEELQANRRVPLLALPPPPPTSPPRADVEREPTCSSSSEIAVAALPAPPMPETIPYPYPAMYPAFYPVYYPVPFPFYPGYGQQTTEIQPSKVLKPTAVHQKIDLSAEGGTASPSAACVQLDGQHK